MGCEKVFLLLILFICQWIIQFTIQNNRKNRAESLSSLSKNSCQPKSLPSLPVQHRHFVRQIQALQTLQCYYRMGLKNREPLKEIYIEFIFNRCSLNYNYMVLKVTDENSKIITLLQYQKQIPYQTKTLGGTYARSHDSNPLHSEQSTKPKGEQNLTNINFHENVDVSNTYVSMLLSETTNPCFSRKILSL